MLRQFLRLVEGGWFASWPMEAWLGNSGTYIIRVQADGSATGVFNEGDFDCSVASSGTVNLSTGQISMSANFDNGVGDNTGAPASITVTGTANAAGASGQLVLTESGTSENGTFTTTKTSTSPTAVPTPSALRAHSNTSPSKGKRLGHK